MTSVRSKTIEPKAGLKLIPKRNGRIGRPKSRRQTHGLAWHWRQTDCWYYTLPGTKRRVALCDEDGNRIRGKEKRDKARLAMARVSLEEKGELPISSATTGPWLVARVCSEYIQYCERRLAKGTISAEHNDMVKWVLNDLCKYCGALPTVQLKKAHIHNWIDTHENWRTPATHRTVITVAIAAFNYATENFELVNPLRGLKKPAAVPRLHSLTEEEEKAMLQTADPAFRNFLFAAMQTGLRPFCELAQLTADNVEESTRGMMWRVYSSKTKKTRKIPVRPEVAKLTRRLIKSAPRGSGLTLFRTTRDRKWSRENGVIQFTNLRKKLGWHHDPVRKRYSCYSCRHTFAHRMLSGYWNKGVGCSIETMAELIGDTPKVAFDHYGREWGQHFQDPLWAAIGAADGKRKRRN